MEVDVRQWMGTVFPQLTQTENLKSFRVLPLHGVDIAKGGEKEREGYQAGKTALKISPLRKAGFTKCLRELQHKSTPI